ncbi:NTP transferase domain-containing protein [Aquipuribacter sp. MA13-6]|uniref:NTP transferase domain-containing protein n=1 Tax=unclassified Aquipuribacter TaxID=2635084 RepID=UPI003EEBE478
MATARSPDTSPPPGPVARDDVARWSLVMPVKGGARAKSRLARDDRQALARAIALDAVAAAVACPAVAEVVVVTADEEAAREHAALGARVVTDPGAGLLTALLTGAAACDPSTPCGLLLADLPALRPEDLSGTLSACLGLLGLLGEDVAPGRDGLPRRTSAAPVMVTVPDADGDGTVLLCAARPGDLRPRFGSGSATAHAAVAHVLGDVPEGVRRDVDTDEHLRCAVALGVGPRTAQVLAAQPRSTMAPSDASFSPKRS